MYLEWRITVPPELELWDACNIKEGFIPRGCYFWAGLCFERDLRGLSKPVRALIPARSAFNSSCFECSSRPWGFEFSHAYFSLEKRWIHHGSTHDSPCLDMGFETLNLVFLILWIESMGTDRKRQPLAVLTSTGHTRYKTRWATKCMYVCMYVCMCIYIYIYICECLLCNSLYVVW